MKRAVMKWLPIIFGCHQRPERSFFVRGKQFPLCARCTGELIGILITPFIYCVIKQFPLWIFFIMLIPLVFDGTIQAKTEYESNNTKRILTGIFFGIGLMTLFMLSTELSYKTGLNLRKYLFKP